MKTSLVTLSLFIVCLVMFAWAILADSKKHSVVEAECEARGGVLVRTSKGLVCAKINLLTSSADTENYVSTSLRSKHCPL